MRARHVGLVFVLATLVGCSNDDAPVPSGSTPGPATAATSTPAPDTCPAPCYGAPEAVGSLAPDVVVEVSGMAGSVRTPGVYYVVGDEPGTSSVAAVREDGSLIAHLELTGMAAENAEALAVGPCGPADAGSCLFVADIGDHVGRPDVVIYRAPEPDLTDPLLDPASAIELRYTYPDSPTDAEALLVDGQGRPLIISKADFDEGATGPTRLYRGDLGGGVLEDLGEIAVPAPARPVFAELVGNVVTDASATAGRVLLRTYDDLVEYVAPQPGADLADFPDWPHASVPAPAQIQSETVAYRVGGCGYLTTSEVTGSVAAVDCVGT